MKVNFIVLFCAISFSFLIGNSVYKHFGNDAVTLKRECEKDLARNEKCIMQFIKPEEDK